MLKQSKKRTAKSKPKQQLFTSRQKIEDFYEKILIMQEEEKRRLSRDLHDETGQIVVALGVSLNVMEKELKAGNTKAALGVISQNRKLIQEISMRMKSMALNLRPPAMDILGLAAVLREYFSQWTKANPIKIEFNENTKGAKLDENIEITLYRIVQEAICNILKHSEATQVKVDLIHTEKNLQLIIEDNGRGFNVKKYLKQKDITKMGLQGIKERVRILNGAFSVTSLPKKGTKLTVFFPLN